MEMFDTHRRDILNFDNYMDLKKPGFGGPKSAVALRDARGNKIDKNPKLDGYSRTVERDPAFSHPVYDPTYKAMTHDLVYKQEKKKPFTYDHTRTGIPVVEIEPLEEGKTYTSFTQFINEMDDYSTYEEYPEDEYFEEEEYGMYPEDEYFEEEEYGMYPEDEYFEEEEYPEDEEYGMYPEDDLQAAENRLKSLE